MTTTRLARTSASSFATLTLVAALSGCGALQDVTGASGEGSKTEIAAEKKAEADTSKPSSDATKKKDATAEQPSASDSTTEATSAEATEDSSESPASDSTTDPTADDGAPLVLIEGQELQGISDVTSNIQTFDAAHMGSGNNDFEMSLTVDGPQLNPECRDLVTEIDTFKTPAKHGSIGQYRGGFAESGEGAPTAVAAVVQTEESQNIMERYTRLADICNASGGPVTADFTKVDGLDAVRIHITNGSGELFMVVGGKSVGDKHFYGLTLGIDPAQGEEFLRQGAAKFEQNL